MSRQVFAPALVALLLGASSLAAQDSAATLARMERRLDSLRAVVAASDSAARLMIWTDTVVVGPLRIATTPALRPDVHLAATAAWERLRARFGAALAGADLPALPLGPATDSVPADLSVELVAEAIELMASQEVWGRQDSALVQWLRNLPLDVAGALGDTLLTALVSTPAISNAGCIRGDVAACAVALGLGPAQHSVEAWYAPEAWPGLVERDRASLDPQWAPERSACVERGELAVCQAILSRRPPAPPLPLVGRALLTQLALESGGPGAFERLVANPDAALGDRLAAAARQPLDSLLATWLSVVRSAPPDETPARSSEFLIVIAWVCPALLLSLRGSRCR